MLYRRVLKMAARLALLGLLSTQAAGAVAGCVREARSAIFAVAAAGTGGGEPCHEGGPADPGAALCVVHCVTGGQVLDKPSLPLQIPAVPVEAGFSELLPRAAPLASRDMQELISGPPARILFRSLRI